MQDFVAFVHDNDLYDVVPQNGMYTWMNKRDGFLQIAERLDRFLIPQW